MKLIAMALLAAITAVPAFADDAAQTAKAPYIKHFDANKDGHMSADEHDKGRKGRFADMDVNKDGKLSKEEFVNGHDSWRTKADTNKNGMVEEAEYITFFCGGEPKPGDKKLHQDAGKYYVQCVAHRKAIFASEDLNKDGKVTPEEHKAAQEAAFKKMDKNGDMSVTLDEFYSFYVELDSKPETAAPAPHKGCPGKAACKGKCAGCNGNCKCGQAKTDAPKTPETKPAAAPQMPAKPADKK